MLFGQYLYFRGLAFLVSFFLILFPHLVFSKAKHHHNRRHVYINAERHSSKIKRDDVKPISELEIKAAIQRLIIKHGINADIGVFIRSQNNSRVIYGYNEKKLFIPASSLKNFTAVVALKQLGPNYRFKTLILTKSNSSIVNGVLNGDLYFYFGGDPTLRLSHLESLVAALRSYGINKINGNVYIDDNILDQEGVGPGWLPGEENFCYASPVNAFILDRNCLLFKIVPAPRENKYASVFVRPERNFIPILNYIITKRYAYDGCPLRLNISRDNAYYLTGCVSYRLPSTNFLVPLKNVRVYSQGVVARLLEKNKINFSGTVKFTSDVSSANLSRSWGNIYTLLASHDSPALYELTKVMLKRSDNLIADSLFKAIGIDYFKKQGSWQNSSAALRAILTHAMHVDIDGASIVDGSGLSHLDLLTPKNMVDLLDYAYRDSDIKKYFYDALPISGIDGSLRFRISTKGLIGKVHAKTGTMKNIVSLAGFVTSANGKVLTFAIMINNFKGHFSKYRLLEDKICALLARAPH